MLLSVKKAFAGTKTVEQLIGIIASMRLKQTQLGRSSFVVTSKGDEVKTAFKVVDALDLIISNNLDGTINPLT